MLLPAHAYFSKKKGVDETQGVELTVAAASALRPVFEVIAERYQEKTGVEVVLVYSSSGNLARQISHGAPFDLFASSNTEYIDELITEGHLQAKTREVFARGRLVIACNSNSGVKVQNLEDLLREEVDRISVANPSYAPYGVAAREAMEKAGVWDSVREKVVYADTVIQALQYVQSGNTPVGIVAEPISNVPEISSVPLDEGLYSSVEHTLAVVKETPNPEIAKDLAGFICSSEGIEIIEGYGFYEPAI